MRRGTAWQTIFQAPLQPPARGDTALDESALRPAGLGLRQFVPLPQPLPGTPSLRLRLSNEFGDLPLEVAELRVAWRAGRRGAVIRPDSDRPVRFGGRSALSIAPGGSAFSDAVALPARPRDQADADLAVSLDLAQPGTRASWHPVGSRSSYRSVPGRHARDTRYPVADAGRALWYLAQVEAAVPRIAPVWIAFGDSITDGAWHPVDTDGSWPLQWAGAWARRSGRWPGVLNAGLGGNRLLQRLDGPSGVERFDRDVLAVAGVQGVVLLIGINDLGGSPPGTDLGPLVDRLVAGLAGLALRARRRGLKVVGATLTPVGGSPHFRPDVEAARQALNRWIRHTVAFDALVDFDRLLRDPGSPGAMRPEWTGDGLHPTAAGYRVMAKAVLDTLDRAELAGPLS